MTLEETKHALMKLGLSEGTAEAYLEEESETWAVLPAFRLLKPLNDRLEFYQGPYQAWMERCIQDGTLQDQIPEAAPLLAAGAAPEQIQQFAYQLVLNAYEQLLYQLDDPEGAEVDEVFCDPAFSESGHARLMEAAPDGTATGRYLIEVHGKLPFSELLSEQY